MSEPAIQLRTIAGGVEFGLKVSPGARRSAAIGAWNGRLRVAVSAPPERGRANDAVVALLAETLALRPAQVQIVRGHTAAQKTVRIENVDESELAARLRAALAHPGPQP